MISRFFSVVKAIWRLGVVIWVCRIPFVATVAAAMLVAVTPQGRDLFEDLGISWQWIVFFLLCFCWAWIVHSSARNALQCDEWVPQAHDDGLSDTDRDRLQKEFYWHAVWVPRVLGILTLLLVGWGIYRSWRNVKTASEALEEAAAATQLSLELLFVTIAITIFFTWLVINWRTKINRGADEPTVQPCLTGHAPLFANLFGGAGMRASKTRWDVIITAARGVILVAIIFAIVAPLLTAAWIPRLFFVPLLFSGIVLIFGEFACWSHRLRTPLLLVLVGISLIFVAVDEHYNDVRWIKDTDSTPHSARQVDFAGAVERWMAANNCTGDAKKCPRPILVAAAGGASRAAFLTASVVGSLLDIDNTDISREIGPVRPRIFAISSVSGGSVGAAVIRAALADRLQAPEPNRPPCEQEDKSAQPAAGWVGTSWFGTWVKARDPRAQLDVTKSFDVTKSWRDCFQRILAGDFLTPVFFGLAYRDNFPTPLWGDRAQLLERAFEVHYNRMTGQGHATVCPNDTERAPTILRAMREADPRTGLCRPFGYLFDRRSGEVDGRQWVPLLFINATSVTTGRRVIVSDVKIGDKYKAGDKDILLPYAYDLWELRSPKPDAAAIKTMSATAYRSARTPSFDAESTPDIRLSTAAVLSARFPIVSPPGSITAIKDNKIVEEAVDGGYFENDGLATIADVAAAMKAVQKELEPVVLHIVNDPDVQPLGERAPLPQNTGRTPFEGVVSIFRTLTTTESGHEDGHEAYLDTVVGAEHVYRIAVSDLLPTEQSSSFTGVDKALAKHFCPRPVKQKGTMEFLSLSWWISQPVQAYLDSQLCNPSNVHPLICGLQNRDFAKAKDGLPDRCVERKRPDAPPESG